MTGEGAFRDAAAAGILGSEEGHRALLQATVDTARAIFGARAASVFLHDEDAGELVFEAVSGEGEAELVGTRLPAGTGIAGWVLTTRQPIVIDDLQADPRFARQAAERTGYVPRTLMAVPLLHDEDALGVLQVLDRTHGAHASTLAEMDLLLLFAHQAAIGLDLLERARRARRTVEGDGTAAAVAALAALLDAAGDEADEDGRRLLEALTRVLRRRR